MPIATAMITSAAIGGLASAGSSAFSASKSSSAAQQASGQSAQNAMYAAQLNAWEADKARAFDADQVLKQQAFAEKLSSSAHQREVADLRAAGLNPILSGTGGMGSATPTTSAAHSPSPVNAPATAFKAEVPDYGRAVDAALNSARAAIDWSQAQAEVGLKTSQTANVMQDTLLKQAQTATEGWGPENRKWATELLSAEFNKVLAEKDAIRIWNRRVAEALAANYQATTRVINQELRSATTKAELDEAFMKIERIINMGGKVVDSAATVVPPTRAYRRER